MATLTEYFKKDAEIRGGNNPNATLARYLNGLAPEARVFFIVNVVGWQDDGRYLHHVFETEGTDEIIELMLH